MKYLFFFIIIFPIRLLAQHTSNTIIVEYNQITKEGQTPLSNNYKLFILSKKSLYEQVFEDKKNETVHEADGSTAIFEYPKKNMMQYCITDLTNKKLQFKDVIVRRTVVVNDEFIDFNWKITDEIKKIGSYDCKKATMKFRGRNYTAWFANKFPFSLGPWKLHGLPGLILEAYDDEKIFFATVTKINAKQPTNAEERILSLEKEKKIDLRVYIKQKQNEREELVNLLNSKLPKGAKKFSICKDCGSTNSLEFFETRSN